MIRTKKVLASIFDGIFAYAIWYFYTAFMLWAGIHLALHKYSLEVGYLQCFGAVMAIRQIVGLLRKKGDRHVKDPKVQEDDKIHNKQSSSI